MKIINRFFLITLMLLCSIYSSAQFKTMHPGDFNRSEGYFVTLEGKKIYGQIRYVPSFAEYKKYEYGFIEIITEKGKPQQIIKSEECLEFAIGEDNNRFIPFSQELKIKYGFYDLTIKSDFLQVVSEGHLSLYCYYLTDGKSIALSSKANKMGGYSRHMVVKKEGDNTFYILPVLEKRRDELLKKLFPGDQEVIEVFYQGGPKKILAALDTYNLKHKK